MGEAVEVDEEPEPDELELEGALFLGGAAVGDDLGGDAFLGVGAPAGGGGVGFLPGAAAPDDEDEGAEAPDDDDLASSFSVFLLAAAPLASPAPAAAPAPPSDDDGFPSKSNFNKS